MYRYNRPRILPVTAVILLVFASGLARPGSTRAECQEFKIVEYEDRVEAVCIGVPLTDAQIKANQEEQKRQEQETHRQRVEEQNRQREAARAAKAQADAELEGERKRRGQTSPPPRPIIDSSKTVPKKF